MDRSSTAARHATSSNHFLTPAIALVAILGACTGDAPVFTGQPADTCMRLGVPGSYAGDISLAPGEAARLYTDTHLCLVIPGAHEDTYALAYVDTRPIEAARNAPEPSNGDSLHIIVGAAGSSRGTRMVTVRAPSPPSDVRVWTPSNAEGDAGSRATPWVEGDTFNLRDVFGGGVRPATVLRVYDGWLVVAAFTRPIEPRMAGMLKNLDLAWLAMRETGLPMLHGVFGDSLPLTSAGSRQFLVVVRGDLGNYAGVEFGGTDGARTLGQIALLPYDSPANAPFVASVLVHEVTHAFQRQHISATRPPGTPPTTTGGAAIWAIEGGASLMEVEMARRIAGVPWAANWDFRNASSVGQLFYAQFAFPGRGAFVDGYARPASFLRDMVQRRVRTGEPVDDALAQVMRGAIEGWFGHVDAGTERAGLSARMRPIFPAWQPADALLAWTLSHAADDVTPSPTYQDDAFLRVWDNAGGDGWGPAARVSPGSAPVTVIQDPESAGYFEMSGGGTYALRSRSSGVRWMIVRLR